MVGVNTSSVTICFNAVMTELTALSAYFFLPASDPQSKSARFESRPLSL